MSETSFYDAVGGHETFARLVHRFYEQVAADQEFRKLYPEQDLGPAEHRLLTFLEQYWGGPKTYQAERGHPRLVMRHRPFRITPVERDTWLRYMLTSLDELQLSPERDAEIRDYLTRAAHALVNTFEAPGGEAVIPVIG